MGIKKQSMAAYDNCSVLLFKDILKFRLNSRLRNSGFIERKFQIYYLKCLGVVYRRLQGEKDLKTDEVLVRAHASNKKG